MRVLGEGGAGDAFTLSFEGEPIEAHPGETLAAALAARGRLALRRAKDGSPRGLHCGMGVCFECLVHVSGESNVRACLRQASPGDGVFAGAYRNLAPRPPAATARRAPESAPNPSPDVLVIGGGPAGLSAALAAARAGAAVVLLDERARLGGQYYKQPAEPHRFASGRFPDRQFRDGHRLIERVRASGVEIHEGALVWGVFDELEVSAFIGAEPASFSPARLILATGAYERSIPMPGWTLPGFMTTGAVQTLLRAHRVSPGERVLISGHGPLNLQVAAELVRAGVRVVALLETSRPARPVAWPAAAAAGWHSPDLLLDAARYAWTLKRAGVPILTGHSVVEARGSDKVAYARVARLAETGSPIARSARWFETDVVAVSYGFLPSNEIARALGCEHRPDPGGAALVPVRSERFETTVAGVYVVGDCAGLGGARAALEEGAIAGAAAAREDRKSVPASERAAARRLARHRRFQAALWRVYRSPTLIAQLAAADTLVCRCEEVSLGAIVALAAQGCGIGAVKRRTRAGMGRCQGRYCSHVIQHLLAHLGGAPPDERSGWAPRMPFKPVPVLGVGRGE